MHYREGRRGICVLNTRKSDDSHKCDKFPLAICFWESQRCASNPHPLRCVGVLTREGLQPSLSLKNGRVGSPTLLLFEIRIHEWYIFLLNSRISYDCGTNTYHAVSIAEDKDVQSMEIQISLKVGSTGRGSLRCTPSYHLWVSQTWQVEPAEEIHNDTGSIVSRVRIRRPDMAEIAGIILAHQCKIGTLIGTTVPRRAISNVCLVLIYQLEGRVCWIALVPLRPLLYPCWYRQSDTSIAKILATFILDGVVVATVEFQNGNGCPARRARF